MYNAQRIRTDFVKYMKTSTKTQITSSELLAWLTLSNYDSKWKGNTQNYILDWYNCMQEYRTYCTDSNDHFTDGQKLKMLQNAVHDVPDLQQVRINADHAVAEGRKRPTYGQYNDLLLSASDAHDGALKGNQNKNFRCQQVYLTDTVGNMDDNYNSEKNEDYNVDTFSFL
jgi:hypothetical protein